MPGLNKSDWPQTVDFLSLVYAISETCRLNANCEILYTYQTGGDRSLTQVCRVLVVKLRKPTKKSADSSTAHISVLSIFPPESRVSLGWYRYWVQSQANSLPDDVQTLLSSSSNSGKSPRALTEGSPLLEVYLQVASYRQKDDSVSISLIVTDLIESGKLKSVGDYTVQLGHSLVFAIFSWQTMLWASAFKPPSSKELAISAPRSAGGSQIIKRSAESDRLPLYKFLFKFGRILPTLMSLDGDDIEAGKDFITVSPSELNCHLLCGVGDLRIRWSSVLAQHLELDPIDQTITLFMYPSFVAACLTPDPADPSVLCPSVLRL
jgi:hypothetical protein